MNGFHGDLAGINGDLTNTTTDFKGNIMGIHWEYNRNVNGNIMNGLG